MAGFRKGEEARLRERARRVKPGDGHDVEVHFANVLEGHAELMAHHGNAVEFNRLGQHDLVAAQNNVEAIARHAQSSGRNLRSVEAGCLASIAAGRMGRGTRLPWQFGQVMPSLFSAQSRHQVHS